MKRKPAVFLAAVVVALGLLLGTSAVTAQEPQTIKVNPGTRGEQALDLAFDVTLPGTNDIDLVFTENKTLEFGAGPLGFMFRCTLPNCAVEDFSYNGSLLDTSGAEIPGTAFSGKLGTDAAEVGFLQPTAWKGMRFKGSFTPGPYVIIWLGIPRVGTDDQFTLTVNKSGEGFGTVTSEPSGIDCGNTCSADFDNGTSVTLTATPDEGFELTSWSGCGQTQADTCTVSMTTARTVTVTFAEQGEPIVNLDGDTATGIQNLNVGGALYNVAFLLISADELYGSDPVFDFPDSRSAKAAKIAVNLALNTDNRATKVGPSSDQGAPDYGIGFSKTDGIDIHIANYVGEEIQAWVDADVDIRDPSVVAMYADFTLAGPPPDPVTIGGTVTGLEGSGLVLQNRGTDDLPITENGDFTFSTLLTPGNFYNVEQAVNPTNPEQTCIVENGIGQVPLEPVTDVVVTCVEGTPQVTIGGTVTGLVGSGLVLDLNDGLEQLPITADGTFTFTRTRTSGTFYYVTVAVNPKNPSQTCIVENGIGQVPLESVTDVAVSCVEVPVSDISKVAAEGDTIGGTTLSEILQEGGVAINSLGKVAFHGKTGNTGNTPAVFTQDELVAKKGETLPGTDDVVDRIYDNGGVAINLLGEVAFHGRESNRYETVFTDKQGVVAKEGVPLGYPPTIPEEISDSGKVAINLFGQVAFHGKIEIGSGLSDKESFQAVFNDDGLVVKQGDTLPDSDNTIVEEINDSGGVAINDFGTVAFHGEVVDPDSGVDTVAAVFTQYELVAKEGSILGDDIVSEINKDAGVAINFVGDVAFQARVVDPETGIDTGAAVFTQDGVVVKEGDILGDNTIVDEISDIGGVAINEFGEVAFHGKTGSTAAVFTQYRVVAKEGDNLTGGTTTLDEINDAGGVAINAFGEVTFHGKSNGIDAVFMSGISLPPSDSRGEDNLFTSITW